MPWPACYSTKFDYITLILRKKQMNQSLATPIDFQWQFS